MVATLADEPVERLYTAEELLELEDGFRYELLDGHLVERVMGAEAGRIEARILRKLDEFCDVHDSGYVFSPTTGYILFPEQSNRVRFPDGSFVKHHRLPNDQPPRGYIRLAPDLAVEVISPNDEACDLQEKIEEYLQAGVQPIWVIYPRTKRIIVFRADGTVSRLTETESIVGDSVLPGFSCPVADLFK